jgi:hypothetical protein
MIQEISNIELKLSSSLCSSLSFQKTDISTHIALNSLSPNILNERDIIRCVEIISDNINSAHIYDNMRNHLAPYGKDALENLIFKHIIHAHAKKNNMIKIDNDFDIDGG